jgi:hypothetical protein
MQQDLTNLLSKEMDRRDFLKHVAFGLVALTGMSTFLKAMSDMSPQHRNIGYGASAYGGHRSARR